MKTLLFWLVLSLFIVTPIQNVVAKPLNLNQILDATCRVTAGGGMGSGICYAYKDGKYWFLSNQHVCGNAQTVYIEQFRRGLKSKKIGARVAKTYGNSNSLDFALLYVPEESFGPYPPRVIPLAPENYVAKDGGYCATAGAPSGGWIIALEGKILNTSASRTSFRPAPVGGQSGSGLLIVAKDKDGEYQTYIYSLVTWRVGDGSEPYGAGVLISNLRKAMKGQVVFNEEPVPSNYKHPILKIED